MNRHPVGVGLGRYEVHGCAISVVINNLTLTEDYKDEKLRQMPKRRHLIGPNMQDERR